MLLTQLPLVPQTASISKSYNSKLSGPVCRPVRGPVRGLVPLLVMTLLQAAHQRPVRCQIAQ